VHVQPPASLKALGDPIYEVFYGLTEQPFAITTDPRFFYLSASHQRAFSELLNGLRRRESMLMLTGDTGTGKTTLCRAVLHALGDRTFSAIILNPYMTGAEVLRIVLRDFGLVSHEELRRGGLASADVAQLLDTLEGFLRALVPLGSHAVLVLDEAQSLAPGVLDQIRMLTGLEYQGQRLLQVVLCGQPGLLQTIKVDGLLALNERITRRVELTALPPEDIPGYIQHRLGVAGGSGSVRFDAAAMQMVADLSRGLPRRINVLCDRALQEGRIEGVNIITADLVKRAARALAGMHDPPLTSESDRLTPQAGPRTIPVSPTSVTAQRFPSTTLPPVLREPVEPGAEGEVARHHMEAPVTTAPPAPAPRPTLVQVPPAPAAVVPPADQVPLPPEGYLRRPTPEAPVETAAPPSRPAPGPASLATPVPVSAPRSAAMTAPDSMAAPAPAAMAQPAAARPASTMAATRDLEEGRPDVATLAASTRELSFGVEKPRTGNRGRWLAVAAVVILAVVAAGNYAAWSWDVREPATLVAQAPAGPGLSRGTPAVALPVPPIEEMNQVFVIIPAPRRAPVDVPELVETPPEAAIPMAPNVVPTFPSF
jgi:general secretion pathway protein A